MSTAQEIHYPLPLATKERLLEQYKDVPDHASSYPLPADGAFANAALDSVPTAELAQRCAVETAKFLRKVSYDPHVCLELLRRALVAQSDEAFTYVYHLYEPLVLGWVSRHSGFALTGECAEYFTNAAFRSFYFAVRGAKFECFATLGAILGYLKTCVHTEIGQYLRRHGPIQVPLDEVYVQDTQSDPEARVHASDLWDHICQLLPDERDRQLAHYRFVLNLTPRQICAAYPAQWRSEREVSLALYRIRCLLRADRELAALAGLASPTD
jgi:hypothetical protein